MSMLDVSISASTESHPGAGPHSRLQGDNSDVAVAVFLSPPLPFTSLHPWFPSTGVSTQGEMDVDVLAATRQESGRAGLVYTVMLGTSFDIFCSACLRVLS